MDNRNTQPCHTIGLVLFLLLIAADSSAPASVNAQQVENAKSLTDGIHLDPQEASFTIVEGEGKGKIIPMSLTSAEDAREEWVLTFEGLYSLLVYRTDTGALETSRIDILEEKRRIVFAPFFILLDGEQHVQQNGKIDVVDMETGEISHSGTYEKATGRIRPAVFDTPVGKMNGYKTGYDLTIHLDFAVIRIDLEIGWHRDHMLVYWRSTQTIEKLFGLFSDNTFRVLAISDAGNSETQP